MNIFIKTTLIISSALLMLTGAVYWGARHLVLESFVQLEAEQMQQNLYRFDSALQRELDLIQIMVVDWAEWDDTYYYMQDFSRQYETSNISPSTFASLDISGIFYLDSGARVVSHFGFDEGEGFKYLPEFIASLSSLASHKALKKAFNGLVQIDGSIYMLASNKIIRSSGSGEARGTLIMIRPFNDAVVSKLASQTLLDISLIDQTSLRRALLMSRPAAKTSGVSHWSAVTADNEVTGVTEIYDVYGNLLKLAQIAAPRDVYQQGVSLLNQFIQLLLLSSIGFLLLILWLLRKNILRRLHRLSKSLVEIGQEHHSGRLVEIEGDDEIAVVARASNQMLAGLERFYLQQQYTQENQRVQNSLLVSLAKEHAIVNGDINKAAHKIAEAMVNGCILGRASVWIFNDDMSHFDCVDCIQKLEQVCDEGMSISYDEMRDMVGHLRNSPMLKVENSLQSGLVRPLVNQLNSKAIPCSMLVMSVKHKGQLHGFVVAENFQLARHFQPTEEVFLLSLAEFVEHTLAARERKVLEKELWRLASYDNLTEIPNRSFFYRCLHSVLDKADKKDQFVALLFVDLDDFKPINDAYGHSAGDYILKQTAKRIKLAIRDDDLVARLGGDEFVVMLNNVRDLESAETVAQKLIQHISNYVVFEGNNLKINCSMGIALYPEHSLSADELVSKADQAMYLAKNKGKNTYQVYLEASAE